MQIQAQEGGSRNGRAGGVRKGGTRGQARGAGAAAPAAGSGGPGRAESGGAGGTGTEARDRPGYELQHTLQSKSRPQEAGAPPCCARRPRRGSTPPGRDDAIGHGGSGAAPAARHRAITAHPTRGPTAPCVKAAVPGEPAPHRGICMGTGHRGTTRGKAARRAAPPGPPPAAGSRGTGTGPGNQGLGAGDQGPAQGRTPPEGAA